MWLAESVCLRGQRHEREGTPAQDAVYIARNQAAGAIALVACDGAGSRIHSAFGAAAVSKAVGDLLVSHANEVFARRLGGAAVVEVALDVIEEQVRRRGGAARDYACTVVALLLHGGRVMTCHVGDGAIYVLEAERPICLSEPERGDNGGTWFITSPGVKPRMWDSVVEQYVTGYLVTTDGADCLRNPTTGRVHGMVAELCSQLDFGRDAALGLRDLCKQDLWTRTDDDVSVLALRRPGVAGRYGCPLCGGPQITHLRSKSGRFELGKCRTCDGVVYRRPLDAQRASAPLA